MNEPSRERCVLFDFDGVIADSFLAAYETTKSICPHVTEEEYRRRFEGNINEWLDEASTHSADCKHDLNFFDMYVPKIKHEVRIVPGMEDVISTLALKYRLVVISSTITSPIQDFLDTCGLGAYFDLIMGNDVHKSKKEKIRMVFEKYTVDASQCVFVTDTLGDIHEASSVGVSSIAVTWGFHDSETLLKGAPFRIVDHPHDMLIAVGELFNN